MNDEDGSREKILPCEGAALSALVLEGNGKDCDARIRLIDGRRFEIPLSGARALVDIAGQVRVRCEDWGDTMLRLTFDGPELVLAIARVNYPGSDEEWEHDALAYGDEKEWGVWAVDGATFRIVGPSAT